MNRSRKANHYETIVERKATHRETKQSKINIPGIF